MNTTRDVTAFGASTALANNGPALQAALADAYNAGLAAPGDVHAVTVPAGLWLLQQTLRIGSDTTLTLDPAATVKWNVQLAGWMLGLRNTGAVSGYAGEHDIVVEGGTWDGNHPQWTTGATLLSFGHAERITVRQTTVRDSQVNHHIEVNASRHVLIEDCVFEGMVEDTESVQIDLAYKGGYPAFGAWDNTPCDDVTIRRCRWQGTGSWRNGTAVGTHYALAGVYHTGIRVEDCDVGDTRGVAFRVWNWRDWSITGRIANPGQVFIIDTTDTGPRTYSVSESA